MARLSFALGLLAVALLGGCSPYVEGFHYVPHPAVAQIRASTTQPAEGQSPLTAYATIVGVRRPDQKEDLPLSIETRLRLDNHGPQEVAFNPRSMNLTTGELVPFPPPITRPPQPVVIPPGQSIFVQANFPFPPGASYDSINLQTLQLHWTVEIDGQPVSQVADFRQVHYYYYDPYWDYPYPYGYYGYPFVGFGGTIVIRR